MIFELKTTNIYRAVKLNRVYPLKLVKSLSWLFFILAIFFLLLLLKPGFLGLSLDKTLGLFIISLILAIEGAIWLAFFNAFSSNFLLKSSLSDELAASVKRIESINLAEYLDFRLALAIARALKF